MKSNFVELDISAAFDWVSHSGLFFKFKSIGVGGSLLSICREFLSNRMQRVVVDGVTSEWIPIVSVVPWGSVLGPLLFNLYTREIFENGLYAYADNSTLPTADRKPAGRPAVAASL